MLEAAFWGVVAASALVIGAEVAFRASLSPMVIGLIMAFGVGTLIASIAFELIEPALASAGDDAWALAIALLGGALVFFLGDRAIDRMGRRGAGAGEAGGGEDDEGGGSGMGIALGTALDGIPETAVLGMSLASGEGLSVAFLVAVWVSNFPESLGSSVDMLASGRPKRWIRLLWLGIAAVSAAAAAVGFVLVDRGDGATGALVQAFAAGALLTMIADEMAPQAFRRSALYTGLATTAGFGLAVGLTLLEA